MDKDISRSRTIYLVVVILLLCVSVVWLFVYGLWHAMRKAGRANAYAAMQVVYVHFLNHGTITNPSPTMEFFLYTNQVSIRNNSYDCILGMTRKSSAKTGVVMAATKEGKVIWFGFDGMQRPKVIEFKIPVP